MEKATYRISVGAIVNRKSTRQVSGYVFLYSGLKFGVTKYGHWWQVSELSTGFLVTEAETRQAAIRKLFDQKFFGIVKRCVLEFGKGKDVNPEINPKQEFLTVYTK